MKFKNVVEAVQWKGEKSRKEVEKLIHPYILDDVIWTDYGTNVIYTLCYEKDGERYQESIRLNGWIIREKDGEIYTCSSENFEKEFEPEITKPLTLKERIMFLEKTIELIDTAIKAVKS